MRNLVGALGRYKRNLKACWGFDCLYGINNEDAEFLVRLVEELRLPALHLLWQQHDPRVGEAVFDEGGTCDHRGARSNPEGPTVDSIDVEIGIPTGKYIDDVMGLDKLLLSTTPKPGQPQSQSSDFLDRVIAECQAQCGLAGHEGRVVGNALPNCP